MRWRVQAASTGIRDVGGGLARAAAHLPGHASAAYVPAPIRVCPVPGVHVARARLRGAARDRPRGRGLGGRARPLHRAVRELALDLMTRAVLLDALGTLVELQPPAPRL